MDRPALTLLQTPALPSLASELEQLRPALAQAAQVVYDAWEQDEAGLDWELGSGGICDRVAAALADVLSESLPDVEFDDGGFEGDDHAWLIISRGPEAWAVDLPHQIYERGGGYNWRKVDGVQFEPSDLVFERLSPEPALSLND